MQLINTRTDYPTPDVAMGTLSLPNGSLFFTLQHDPTPAGSYALEPHIISDGPLAGLQCYALVSPTLGVFHEPADAVGYEGPYPVRTAILIHIGNYPADSLGCILVGASRDTAGIRPNVGSSTVSFKWLMGYLGTGAEGHTLIINEP